jgi:hypothetical protein
MSTRHRKYTRHGPHPCFRPIAVCVLIMFLLAIGRPELLLFSCVSLLVPYILTGAIYIAPATRALQLHNARGDLARNRRRTHWSASCLHIMLSSSSLISRFSVLVIFVLGFFADRFVWAGYQLADDYSAHNFFDGFDFWNVSCLLIHFTVSAWSSMLTTLRAPGCRSE